MAGNGAAYTGAGESRIWLGTLLWTARASLLIFVLSAAALILPAQVQDMLANLADFGDMSFESWMHALGFHGAMILMALGLWYWARAVLLAAFRLPDSLLGRARLAASLGASSPREQAWTLWFFDVLPRALGLGAAVIAIIATARSDKWLQVAIAAAWGIALYYLLKSRLVLGLRFGLAQTGAPLRPPGRHWFGRLWQRLLELLDYAPLGRWIAAWTLALASALFVLSALTAFIPHSIEWKTYFAHLLPGPSVALFLLGMSVAPLTALTYCIDRATRIFTLGGKEIPLRFVPVLLPMLVLMGVGATFLNLHALRIVDDPDAMKPDSRASLAMLFKTWADTCAPGNGPVQPILVAVSGGASRAGLWAARVLDVVDDSVRKSGSRSASIFAVSSVSGGSLGAAAYVAMRAGQSRHRAAGAAAPCSIAALAPALREQRDIAEIEAMRADAIGPALAGMMLGDAPRSLAAYAAWPALQAYDAFLRPEKYRDKIALLRANDRAEALESAFEYNWQVDGIDPIGKLQAVPVGFSEPYLSLFYDNGNPRGDVPVWITNGTDVNTGDRLITVPFKVNGEAFCRGKDSGGKAGTWYPAEGTLPDSATPAERAARRAAKALCGPAASYFWYAMGPFQAARDVLTLIKSDIPISTAIDNTSRFPFLSPSGELTPTQDPRPGELAPPDAQIIDGGYFENEGIMSAMEVADWLRAYGPGLIGRPVYPIVVQATSDADKNRAERDIARCGNRLPLNPGVADGASRGSQFLVPLAGLTAVRSGHSRALLQQALEDFCGEGGQQAFFHFYLYDATDFDVPLNWSLSEKVADFIWDDAIEFCGNKADRLNLIATLQVKPEDWKPQASRLSRDIRTCAGPTDNLQVVTAKLKDLPLLKTGSGAGP